MEFGEYNLELEKIVSEIKKKKAKLVLLQFPDGLKPYATAIVDFLEENTEAEFLILLGDCFGACDTPNLGEVKVGRPANHTRIRSNIFHKSTALNFRGWQN